MVHRLAQPLVTIEEMMENLVLTDKNQFPTDDIIFSNIGPAKSYWIKLFKTIHKNYPDFIEQWKYYNAAKSWLLKIMKKKKTIMWISVFKDYFTAVFYFGEKAEQKIMKAGLSDKLKYKFINGKKFGKIKGIILKPGSDDDITDVIDLIDLILKIK
jgi:hypothetical protein